MNIRYLTKIVLYIFFLLLSILNAGDETNKALSGSTTLSNNTFKLETELKLTTELNLPFSGNGKYFSKYTTPLSFTPEAIIRGSFKYFNFVTTFKNEFSLSSDTNKLAESKTIKYYTTPKFRDNYIAFAKNKINLILGFKIFNWGEGIFRNPADFINPVDYSDLFTPEKSAIFTLSSEISISELFSLDIIFLPAKVKDIFPYDITGELFSHLLLLESTLNYRLPASMITNFSPTEPTLVDTEPHPGYSVGALKGTWRSENLSIGLSLMYDYDTYYTSDTEMVIRVRPGFAPLITEWEIDRELVLRLGTELLYRRKDTKFYLSSQFLITEDLFEDFKLDDCTDTLGEQNPELSLTIGASLKLDKRFQINAEYYGRLVFKYDDKTLSDYSTTFSDTNSLALLIQNTNDFLKFLYRQLAQPLALQNEALLSVFSVYSKIHDSKLNKFISVRFSYFLPAGYERLTLKDDLSFEKRRRLGAIYSDVGFNYQPIDNFLVTLGFKYARAWKKISGQKKAVADNSDYFGRYNNESAVYLKASIKLGKSFNKQEF